ncbi:hypothetical protein C0993_000053 [Termitomyces sp. T159_Od127]|nr:hypothetical protein C0993_000053 [Termitomyces sp. T159_Od127]
MPLAALHVFCLLALLAAAQAVTWTATPFNPASVPLAVRTPYLSAWLPQGAGAALNDVWPTFWTGQILGWAGLVKVDGTAYSFLGTPNVPGATYIKATQRSLQFTTTQSIFVLSAGPIDITVTFLSPVESTDLVKQSTPFAYMAVSAASTDGAAHSVQVYSDISAEWVSGDNSLVAKFSSHSFQESGNMLIMALSYAQKTGDNSHLTQYTALLDQWTQFLITDSLIPANQLSTDDFAGHLANQTNLAVKGIIGIKAMSQIYTILGNTAQSSNYSTSSDWQIWTAAIVTDTTARDLLIGSVKKYAADGLSSQPFGDWYETTNGQPEGFRARPVVGGHLGTLSS